MYQVVTAPAQPSVTLSLFFSLKFMGTFFSNLTISLSKEHRAFEKDNRTEICTAAQEKKEKKELYTQFMV